MSPQELTTITHLLAALGFTLDAEQPHLGGERFLMQALTTVGGEKYILKGTDTSGRAAIIKVTRQARGKQEIEHERTCRQLINQLAFAYDVFAVPEEILHTTREGYLISAQAFIPQSMSFLDRPLLEQYTYALRAFTAQEHSRATTGQHLATIRRTFGLYTADDYLRTFASFLPAHDHDVPHYTQLTAVAAILQQEKTTITQYGNFLTHTDFVPHNFRIKDDKLYLLDFSAIRFGNKHEGWARFINFMTLYHPALADALVRYVADNRAPEEAASLQLMRLYRLGELMTYYRHTLPRSTGDLRRLNEERITFWGEVLAATMAHTTISEDRRLAYIARRDTLRSTDEKKRQVGLH